MRHRWAAAPLAALILVTACQGGGDNGSPTALATTRAPAPRAPRAAVPPLTRNRSAARFASRAAGRRIRRRRFLEETIAAFEEKYPEITVVYEPIPEAYAETMIGQFSTGDPPDLFYVGATGEAGPWIDNGLLLPLDDYIAGQTRRSASRSFLPRPARAVPTRRKHLWLAEGRVPVGTLRQPRHARRCRRRGADQLG